MATAGFCPRCGAAQQAGDDFCRSCGTRLRETGGDPTTPVRPVQAAPPPPPSVSVPPTSAVPNLQTQGPTPAVSYPSQTQPGYPRSYPPPPAQTQSSYQPSYQPAPVPAAVTAPVGSKIRSVPLIGAVAVALASFLPWIADVAGAGSANGFDVPFGFLFDPNTADPGGFDVGLVTLLIGIAGAVLTFRPKKPGRRRLLGIGAVGIGIAYIAQLATVVGGAGADISVTDVIGFGVYVTIGGGVLLAAGK